MRRQPQSRRRGKIAGLSRNPVVIGLYAKYPCYGGTKLNAWIRTDELFGKVIHYGRSDLGASRFYRCRTDRRCAFNSRFGMRRYVGSAISADYDALRWGGSSGAGCGHHHDRSELGTAAGFRYSAGQHAWRAGIFDRYFKHSRADPSALRQRCFVVLPPSLLPVEGEASAVLGKPLLGSAVQNTAANGGLSDHRSSKDQVRRKPISPRERTRLAGTGFFRVRLLHPAHSPPSAP